MNVQWCAHLPGVTLERSDGIPMGPGRLVHPPFSDWSRLDDTFARNDRDYERSRPVFHAGKAGVSDDCDRDLILVQVTDWLYLLCQAFLLDPDAPLLPAPWRSRFGSGWQQAPRHRGESPVGASTRYSSWTPRTNLQAWPCSFWIREGRSARQPHIPDCNCPPSLLQSP